MEVDIDVELAFPMLEIFNKTSNLYMHHHP